MQQGVSLEQQREAKQVKSQSIHTALSRTTQDSESGRDGQEAWAWPACRQQGDIGTAEPSGQEEAHLGVQNQRTKAGGSWLS